MVAIGSYTSTPTSLTCGVPQGLILGPVLFNLYMLPLRQISKDNTISYYSYADDTQIYVALSPNYFGPLESLCQCIDYIMSWVNKNLFMPLSPAASFHRPF